MVIIILVSSRWKPTVGLDYMQSDTDISVLPVRSKTIYLKIKVEQVRFS